MAMSRTRPGPTRRQMLGLGLGLVALTRIAPAAANPASMQAAVRHVLGEASVREGKVKLLIPPLVENGNTVPLSFTVDAPMTDADYVSDVLVVAEGNPNPGVATFHFTALSGKAEASTRIRLATTQNIVVVAKTSGGKFYTAQKLVKVTIGGCGG